MKFKEKFWFPIFYMFGATLILSAVLLVFGSFTRDRVKNNERLAFERSVLEALSIDIRGYAPSAVHDKYVQAIRIVNEQTPDILGLYENEQLLGYALPVAGPGFWAPIKGVIGIDADRRTIIGISFYEQNETPGLGGEIAKPFFRDQFPGKKIASGGMPIEFRMSATELDESSVHMITGATQTSTRLGKFLNEKLIDWRRRTTEGQ